MLWELKRLLGCLEPPAVPDDEEHTLDPQQTMHEWAYGNANGLLSEIIKLDAAEERQVIPSATDRERTEQVARHIATMIADEFDGSYQPMIDCITDLMLHFEANLEVKDSEDLPLKEIATRLFNTVARCPYCGSVKR